MKTQIKKYQAGFTLIEFIVTLVIAAIAATMVYTFMGSMLTKSSEPIFRLQKASNLHQVMENIVADYNRLNALNLRYKWRSGNAYSIGDVVLPSDTAVNISSLIANNGRYYKCTTAGTSGSTIPSWPAVGATTTTLGRTVPIDGSVVWTEQGYVWKAAQRYPADSIVVPALNNGHFYKGPSSPNPFTSGTSVPTHLTGETVSDGNVMWTDVGNILSSAEASVENLYTILPDVNDPILTTDTDPARIRYGTGYTLTEKVFIKFDTNRVETPATSTDENNILKVTIKNNDTAETLTQLFTIH